LKAVFNVTKTECLSSVTVLMSTVCFASE